MKCVIVVDGGLPRGMISNTAAILGISLGRRMPEAVGCDICDKSGCIHSGIIEFPVPILNGTAEQIKDIRKRLYEKGFEDVAAVDFSDIAQVCKAYDEFVRKMSDAEESKLRYFGVGLCGDKKKVTSLTGSLPLLR